MTGKKILVVDDDRAIRMALKSAFVREGMTVVDADGGYEALDILGESKVDLIVLDVMMQDMDGFTLLQKLRAKGDMTPVLMLSGKDQEIDQVLGLGLGADDYLTKPFHLSILIQKVKALIRRNEVYSQTSKAAEMTVGPFTFDLLKLECYKNGEILNLTAREKALFRFLMENPGRVFTKEQLYRCVWNENVVDDNTIMVYIKRLREKLEENPRSPQYIKTVRGIGYLFEAE